MSNYMHEKFEDIALYMLAVPALYAYGLILSRINLIECNDNEAIPTLGVRLNGRNIELFYNKEYVESQSRGQLIFLLLHEIYHVMFHHMMREKEGYNHTAANYVQDAIINNSLLEDSILRQYFEEPREDGVFSGITHERVKEMAQEEYEGLLFFEPYYMWLSGKIPSHNPQIELSSNSSKTQEKTNGEGGGGGKANNSDNKSQNTSSSNTNNSNSDSSNSDSESNSNPPTSSTKVGFDCHLESNCTEEEAQIVANSIINDVKSRGSLPAGIEQHIKYALEKRPDYLKIIKKVISNHLLHGYKKKTFSRPHIYGIEGLKGNIYRQYQINCILDTSGSMSDEIDYVLSFLYKNKVIVTLIQIDTEIHSVQTFKNTKAIVDVKAKGFGGTLLQPAIDYIANNKNLKNYCNLVLTDGYTETLDFSKINKQTLIISTEIKCPLFYDTNKVQQLIIKK